jgi:hypothetical protein
MARIRQSRPDPGLGFKVKVLKTFLAVVSSLASGIALPSTSNNLIGQVFHFFTKSGNEVYYTA